MLLLTPQQLLVSVVLLNQAKCSFPYSSQYLFCFLPILQIIHLVCLLLINASWCLIALPPWHLISNRYFTFINMEDFLSVRRMPKRHVKMRL